MLDVLSEIYLRRSLQLIITKGQLSAGFKHDIDCQSIVWCQP